jgi:hypothetical protein
LAPFILQARDRGLSTEGAILDEIKSSRESSPALQP